MRGLVSLGCLPLETTTFPSEFPISQYALAISNIIQVPVQEQVPTKEVGCGDMDKYSFYRRKRGFLT